MGRNTVIWYQVFIRGQRGYFRLHNLEIVNKGTLCNTKYLLLFQIQPVQHVYPPQVQYVEGGDAIYTNGALYVGVPAPQEGAS